MTSKDLAIIHWKKHSKTQSN